MIVPGGQVVTAFASLRGDVFSIDPTGAVPSGLTTRIRRHGITPTVGAEWSYPIMASLPGSTHIFEPIAQIVARPTNSWPASSKMTMPKA